MRAIDLGTFSTYYYFRNLEPKRDINFGLTAKPKTLKKTKTETSADFSTTSDSYGMCESDNRSEEMVYLGRDKKITMVECQSENNDDSGIVDNTVKFNASEYRSVTWGLSNHRFVGTRAKLDRIEEMLISLKDKARRIAAKTHSKKNEANESPVKQKEKFSLKSPKSLVGRKLKSHVLETKIVANLQDGIRVLTKGMLSTMIGLVPSKKSESATTIVSPVADDFKETSRHVNKCKTSDLPNVKRKQPLISRCEIICRGKEINRYSEGTTQVLPKRKVKKISTKVSRELIGPFDINRN